MLDNKTKERIAQEAEKYYPSTAPIGSYDRSIAELQKASYIKGREAEATRSAELIEAYRELHSISNDQLNEMEKHVKGYEPNHEKVARAWELLKTIEALTNYNNSK